MGAARRAGSTIWLASLLCFALTRALAPVGFMPSFINVDGGYISLVICHAGEPPAESPQPDDDRNRCPYATIAHSAFLSPPTVIWAPPPRTCALVLSTCRDHVASAQRHAPTIGARGPPLLLI